MFFLYNNAYITILKIQNVTYKLKCNTIKKKIIRIFFLLNYRLDLNAADSGVQQKILQCETNTNVEKDKSCMQC